MGLWNKIQKSEIKLICSGKYTCKELVGLLKRNRAIIYTLAKAHKIKLKRPSPIRKYKLNENAFDKWSNNMAYFLGFLMADGYIIEQKRGKILGLEIQNRDLELLNNFKKFINSAAPIKSRIRNGKVYCRLIVCSQKLCNKLIQLGCHKKKTLRLKFALVPKKFISHFIRGYFDGDGHIRIIKPETSPNLNLKIQFTGQPTFLKKIQEIYNINFNNNWGYICHSKRTNSSALSFTGIKSSVPLVKWIYLNSNQYNRLSRKYAVYKRFLSCL